MAFALLSESVTEPFSPNIRTIITPKLLQLCHLSHVTCHTSGVMCPMSGVTCPAHVPWHVLHVFFLFYFGMNGWSQAFKGLLSTGPTPSSNHLTRSHQWILQDLWKCVSCNGTNTHTQIQSHIEDSRQNQQVGLFDKNLRSKNRCLFFLNVLK